VDARVSALIVSASRSNPQAQIATKLAQIKVEYRQVTSRQIPTIKQEPAARLEGKKGVLNMIRTRRSLFRRRELAMPD
jgi:hypothetical protein